MINEKYISNFLCNVGVKIGTTDALHNDDRYKGGFYSDVLYV